MYILVFPGNLLPELLNILFFPGNQLPVLLNFLDLFFSFLLQLFKLALVVLDLSVLLLECLLQLPDLPFLLTFLSFGLHSLLV